MKNTIYAENHFGRVGMFDEVMTNNFKPVLCENGVYKIFFFLNLCPLPGTFNTKTRQNVNYALYTNNICRFSKYINWLCYNNQGDFLIGMVKDTSLCDRKDFTSNKTVGTGKIVV